MDDVMIRRSTAHDLRVAVDSSTVLDAWTPISYSTFDSWEVGGLGRGRLSSVSST